LRRIGTPELENLLPSGFLSKSVEIKIKGKFYSGRYSVQGGIMTLHLGTEAKQARVGRACHRLLARILLYRLLRELQATRQAA
jgi:hypothetical protein